MGNLGETTKFLIESFRTYTGNNPIWLLYPVALVVIWFLGKKEDRKIFIGALVAECLTLFNPFVTKILLDIFGFGNRFIRFFWITVFFITIAYAMTLAIFALKKIWMRILAGGMVLVLIVVLGIPVFKGAEASPYAMTSNEYFIDQEILDLSNIIHSEGIEQPWILADGLLLVYRQYDPTVRSFIRRKTLQKIEQNSEEEFMEMIKKVKEWKKKVIAVYFYHDFSVDVEEFQNLLRECKVNYVISTSQDLDEYLSASTMYILGQTGNCRVWKVI